MSRILRFEDITAEDRSRVGGKGLSLGLMTRAGLPVPPGFVLTPPDSGGTAPGCVSLSETERSALLAAYARLGAGPVAVRSSAVAEDSEDASFAGQHETLLSVVGESALLEAVIQCRESVQTDRASAYRDRQVREADDAHGGTADSTLAVVVQRMVPAEVSGVLFTRDPLDASGERMLVEASWGLGESVVSGRLVPDRYHCRREDGSVVEQQIATKTVQRGPHGWCKVPPDRQQQPCLNPGQLAELIALGRKVEEYFGEPRDIEWAWAEGRFWLLQARPITTPGAFEREQFIREQIAFLKSRADKEGTVWSRYNLAEILPTPTPMTWAVVQAFMSGRGGYGLMLRDLGYDPDPELDNDGFVDLICGRPYVNLSREPKLYFRDFPLGHRFADLKANPERAIYPRPLPLPEKIRPRFLLRLPVILWKTIRNASEVERQSRIWHDVLRQQTFPEFTAEVQAAWREDITPLSPQELMNRFRHWTRRTLEDLARRSLRPAVFATLAMANLEQALKARHGPERAGQLVRQALTGVRPDPEADLAEALARLMAGELKSEEFLRQFGHRGPGEMELAEPRWRERPDSLPSGGKATDADRSPPGRAVHGDSEEAWRQFVEAAQLTAAQARMMRRDYEAARLYTGLRETAKHYLLMGYELMRRYLVELDRRFGLRGGIFFLRPDELPDLIDGKNLSERIRQRRRQRQIALSIEVPTVLFSDDLAAIGRPSVPLGAATLRGTPLSPGTAEGPALVLTQPEAVGDRRDYVLVCPSTDPAWVPLFVRAQALVMEAGGVLSHGAIVAREFGLPAVAGLPNLVARLRTGQRLKVDGTTGTVYVLEEAEEQAH